MPPQSLTPGAAAPRFGAADLLGAPVSLPVNGSWTLLSFLRYATCPACNLRVRELRQRDADLRKAGVQWYAIFHSPKARLERYMPRDAWAHVISDFDRTHGISYGTTRSWGGVLLSAALPAFYWAYLKTLVFGYWGGAIDRWFDTMPADVLVDPKGTVVLAHYGRHLVDHLGVDDVLRAAAGERSQAANVP